MAPSQAPKYLTGDPTAVNEFLDKFDVRHFQTMSLVPLSSASLTTYNYMLTSS